MRVETLALLGVLDVVCASVDQLAAALVEAFSQHPDHEIITSFPGLGDISGAIVLAEIGDDRSRFRDDRALQAFAGSAPVTRASGKSRTVTRRRTRTTGSPRSATAGRSPPPPARHRPAITTCDDANTATATRPRSGTCSTNARPAAPLPTDRPHLRLDKAYPHALPRHSEAVAA